LATLQQQARALGDPTRHAVFAYLADADRPTGVAELTHHFGLNHNAIRQHLAKLVDAGLVVETQGAPHGRGRPPRHYAVHPGADGRWVGAGPYERLAGWLAEAVRTGESAEEVGRRIGRERVESTAGDPDRVAALTHEMRRLGFEPAVDRTGEDVTITLHHCPFAATATSEPATVCRLHLGMARGMAEGIGRLTVTGLTAADPTAAGCTVQVRDLGP